MTQGNDTSWILHLHLAKICHNPYILIPFSCSYYGYELASIMENQVAFDEALDKIMQEIKNSKDPSADNLHVFHQLLDQKKVIWMEGPLGWTTWINKFEDDSPQD